MSDEKKPFDIDELVSQALGNIETQANDIKRKNDDADAYSIHNGFTFAADAKSDDVASENELKSHSSKYEETSQESVKLVDLGEKPITQTANSDFAPLNQPQKSRKPSPKKSKNKAIIWFVSIIVASVLIAGAAFMTMIEIMGFKFSSNEVWITIPQGSSTQQIAEILKENDVIKSSLLFRVYSKIAGADGHYNYGDYEIKGSGYDYIIETLKKAGIQAPEVSVTVKEGATIDEICDLLVKNKVCSEDDFKTAMKKGDYGYDFVGAIPTDKVHYRFEGYLFPETYNFFVLTDDADGVKNAERAIDKMLSQTSKHFTADDVKLAESKGYTIHEILTMASILELEASGFESEMKNVAQVFYNRLTTWNDQPKLLGSTPTSKYPYGNGRYDTNVYEGLPPGPLCSPSADAVKAAISPNTEIKATYFVTDKTMKFYYTNSVSEHNAIIKKLKSQNLWEY